VCSVLVAIGITNQRETTVVWDRITGLPLYNAIGLYWYTFYYFIDLLKLVYASALVIDLSY